MNKKKIFGYLFMGLLAAGATGTVTSCKDYDDDINKNTADIQKLQKDLSDQKTDLEKEIGSLKSQLEEANGTLTALKGTVGDHTTAITEAQSKIAGLESKLNTANKTLESINATLALKADQKALEDSVQSINARMKSIEDGLGGRITTEEGARLAADADLQQQLDAINKLLGADKDGKLNGSDYQALKDAVQKLQGQVGDLNYDALKNQLQSLSDSIDKINANINVLNVLLEKSLRSLVFIPQSYYWGVEATKLLYLDFNAVNDAQWTKDADMNYAVKEKKGYSDDTRYTTAKGTKVLSFAATYHMNPSSAQLDPKKTTVSVESGDLEYINTRAAEAGISVKKNDDGTQAWSAKNGILTVNFDVNDPAKIKSVKNDQKITNFATVVNMSTTTGKDTTVTSDYATLYTESVSGLKLALTNNDYIIAGAPKSALSPCTLTGGTDYGHLMQTVHEAGELAPQIQVAWNSEGVDLRKFVETHYTNVEGKNAKLDDVTFDANFKYVFTLTYFDKGANQTDESAHAAIASDGYTFRPQAPDANGKQTQYGSEQNAAQEIGRTPVVRVTLVDKSTGKVYDYGYIRIKIVDPGTIPAESKDKVVDYTGSNYSYNGECTPLAWSYSTKWYNTEQDLYKALGLTREQFEANYELDGDASSLNQYTITDGKATALTEKIGTASSITDKGTDPDGTKSSTLKWEMTSEQAYKFFVTDKGAGKNIAIRYKSKDKAIGPDVYVEFIAGTKLEGTLPSASLDLDALKNPTIWSEKNGKAASGKYEYDINVDSPNDKNVVANGDKPFEKTLAEAFLGNTLAAKDIIKSVNDYTATKDYDPSKLTTDLVFDASNNNKEFKGLSDKTYVMSVGDNGKTLYANVKGQTAKTAVVKITGDDVNSQKAVYQETAAAKDLLNYKAHNELDDNTLTAVIGIIAKNSCGKELPLTGNTFNVRFLRPINISNNEASIEDAGDKAQVINLMSLMKFTDYRDLWQTGYDKFYGITGVTVVGVNNGEKISTNGDVTTNQNAGKEESLAKVNGAIDFVYHADGTLTYSNYNSTTGDFWVKIPVVVTYDWGEVPQTIKVNVARTHGNAKRR